MSVEEQKQAAAEQERLMQEQERKLNEAFMLTFNCDAGRMALDYLVSKTLHTVCGQKFEANELAHLEGQRYIVAEIKMRVMKGENRQ